MAKRRRRPLRDAYRFPGFVPESTVRGIFGDPKARVVGVRRRRKKQAVGGVAMGGGAPTTRGRVAGEICRAETLAFIWRWRCGEGIVRSVEA